MEKKQIIFIRVMSVIAVLAVMTLLMIFGCGSGLFGHIVNNINTNKVDINSADASIYNLYYYKGLNVIYRILFSISLFTTVMALVCMLARKGMAYSFAKVSAVSVIVTGIFVLFAKIFEGSTGVHKFIDSFFIGKIDGSFETAKLMPVPVVPVILIIIAGLCLCLIKSSGLAKQKVYASAGMKDIMPVIMPVLLGSIFFETLRSIIIGTVSDTVSSNAALANSYICDYFFGDRFVYNLSYAVFILIGLIIAIFLKIRQKNIIAAGVPVVICAVSGLIYYLNPKPLFGFLTLDESLCDIVDAVHPLYIILFIVDVLLLVLLTLNAYTGSCTIKNMLITILVNIVLSILLILILGKICGLAGMYSGSIIADVITALYGFYTTDIRRSHH